MASYFRVSPLFWRDPDSKGWPDQQQKLALYLLTSPHRNTEGLYYLPTYYAAEDLGWTPQEVEDWLGRLVQAGFVVRDTKADVVLIPKAMKYQSPATRKQMIGALRVLEELPENDLMDAFWDCAREFAPKLFECHSKGIDVAFESPAEDEGEVAE